MARITADDVASFLADDTPPAPTNNGLGPDDVAAIIQGNDADPKAVLAQKALKYGIDPTVNIELGQFESGLDPTAKNPKSSATGILQDTIAALRDYNQAHGTAFTQEDLKNQGVGAEVGTWYLQSHPGSIQDKLAAHFAGPAGAQRGQGYDLAANILARAGQPAPTMPGIRSQAQPKFTADDVAALLGDSTAQAADDTATPDITQPDISLPDFGPPPAGQTTGDLVGKLLGTGANANPVQQQLDWSQQAITEAADQIKRLSQYQVPVGPDRTYMTPDQIQAAQASGQLDKLGLTPQQQKGLIENNIVNQQTQASIINDEKNFSHNIAKAQALGQITNRSDVVAKAAAAIPPPLANDHILWGSLMTLIDWLSRPLSIETGVLGGILEGESSQDVAQEAYDAFTGRKKSDFSRVLKAAGVPAMGTYTFGPKSVPGEVLGYLNAGDTSVTTRGALAQVLNVIGDPITYLSWGTSRASDLGNGVLLSDAGKKMFAAKLAEVAAATPAEEWAKDAVKLAARQAVVDSFRVAVDSGDMSAVARGGVQFAGKTIPGTPEVAKAMQDLTNYASTKISATRLGAKGRGEIEKIAATFDRAGWTKTADFVGKKVPDFFKAEIEGAQEAATWAKGLFDQYAGVKSLPAEKYGMLPIEHAGYMGAVKGGIQDLKDRANVIFAGINQEGAKRIFWAIDKYKFDDGQAVKDLPDLLRNAAEEVMKDQKAWRQEEISLGLGQGFLDGYAMRKYKNWPGAVHDLASRGQGISTSLGSINRTRVLADMPVADVLDKLKESGVSLLTDNMKDLYVMRGISSIRATNAKRFLTNVENKYGVRIGSGDWWADRNYIGKHDLVPGPNVDREALYEKGDDSFEKVFGPEPMGPPRPPDMPPPGGAAQGGMPGGAAQTPITPQTAEAAAVTPPVPQGLASQAERDAAAAAQKAEAVPPVTDLPGTPGASSPAAVPTAAQDTVTGAMGQPVKVNWKRAEGAAQKAEAIPAVTEQAPGAVQAAPSPSPDAFKLRKKGAGAYEVTTPDGPAKLDYSKESKLWKITHPGETEASDTARSVDKARQKVMERQATSSELEAGAAQKAEGIQGAAQAANAGVSGDAASAATDAEKLAALRDQLQAERDRLLNTRSTNLTGEVTARKVGEDAGAEAHAAMKPEGEATTPLDHQTAPLPGERPPPPTVEDADLAQGGAPKQEPKSAVFIPRVIRDLLVASGDRESASGFWRGFDKWTGMWKTSVTSPWPAFHVRNATDNLGRAFLDVGLSAVDPRKHIEAMRILNGKEGMFLTALGEEYKYSTIRRMFRHLGLENAFEGKQDLADTYERLRAGSQIPTLKEALQNRSLSQIHPLERAREFGAQVENEARMHLFAAHVRRGDSFEMAAAKVKHILNDYSDLSSFEKSTLRRLIPFYTFTRKSVPLQARLLAREPGRYGALLSLFATPGDQQAIMSDRERHPDYATQGLARQIGTDKNGDPLWFFSSGLSIEDIGRIIPPVRQSGSRTYEFVRQNFLSMLHPVLRAAAEEYTGQDAYLNQPLKNLDRVYSIYGQGIEHMPKWFQDWIGFSSEFNNRGDTIYRMNPTLLHLTRSFIMSRMYSTIGKAFDERKDLTTRMFNNLTGMRLGTVDAPTVDLPAYRQRGYERQTAAADLFKKERTQLRIGGNPADKLDHPSVTARELAGVPEDDAPPPPPNPKTISKAVPDVSHGLRIGKITASDLKDIAMGNPLGDDSGD